MLWPGSIGATMLRIHLPRALLDRRCPAADARAHDAAMCQCALDAMALASRLSAREAAGRCLLETPLAVEAIADHLGYAHPTNFVRAFRRWQDCTPQEFRLRHSRSAR